MKLRFAVRSLALVSCSFVGALAILSTGCEPAGPDRYPVSGSVTLDGKPLDDGVIYFKTVSTGAIDTIPILAGKYQGQAEPGERRVEIASVKVETVGDGEMKSEIEKNLIPAAYNTNSTLTETVSMGDNQFDYELKSSGK